MKIFKGRERVLHTMPASVRVELAGNVRIPMRVLLHNGEPVIELIEYFIERPCSDASQRNCVLGFALLIDFSLSNPALFSGREAKTGLALYAQALLRGTIGTDGHDASGLYWLPTSRQRCITLVDAALTFADWLVERGEGGDRLIGRRPLTWPERLRIQRRADNRKAHSLLAHTISTANAVERAVIRPGLKAPLVGLGEPKKAFPEAMFMPLLTEGYGMPLDSSKWHLHSWNARQVLIDLLMHGGGLRVSQAMHIWVDDVLEDPRSPGKANVRVYHPEHGRAPPTRALFSGEVRELCRSEYLRELGLLPKTIRSGTQKVGWKECALDDPAGAAYLPVFWFPEAYGILFYRVWRHYLRYQRPSTSRSPFAWLNTDPLYGGEDLTIGSYTDGRRSAVHRIGLPFRKSEGTTPHGGRHAYGKRLKAAGLDGPMIQRCMHHRSPDSHLVYTAQEVHEINRTLNAALNNMSKAQLQQPMHMVPQSLINEEFSD